MILKCSCKHEWQDKEYGPGMRVHNLARKGYNGRAGWRCTVCERVKPFDEGKNDTRPLVSHHI